MKNKLKKLRYTVTTTNTSYSVYATIDLSADESNMAEVAEFVCRANYGLRNGNFELDFRDGEVRYKCFVNCDGTVPDREVVKDSIYIPYFMMKKYGDELVAVLFGMKSGKDAVAAAEA